MDQNSLITDQKQDCNVFNDFYVNIAKKKTQSIWAIIDNAPQEGYNNFDFKPAEQGNVLQTLQSLCCIKGTGIDQIPRKIIKDGVDVLSVPICNIFNPSVSQMTSSS